MLAVKACARSEGTIRYSVLTGGRSTLRPAAAVVRAEQDQVLMPRGASPDPSSLQQQADAEAVSAMLEAAGFAPVPPDAAAAAAAEELEQPAGQDVANCTGGAGSAAAVSGRNSSPDRLRQVRSMLLEKQRLAAMNEAREQAEAAARAAAESLARRKAYKYVRLPSGPSRHCNRLI